MAIYNKEIQYMTCQALYACTIESLGVYEKAIYVGLKDTAVLSVTARQKGPTIRFYWRHDGDRISKAEAVRFMRHHETIDAALNPKPECCKVSAEDRELLNSGEYTPEELFGIVGKPSCPKCFNPKPEAGSHE